MKLQFGGKEGGRKSGGRGRRDETLFRCKGAVVCVEGLWRKGGALGTCVVGGNSVVNDISEGAIKLHMLPGYDDPLDQGDPATRQIRSGGTVRIVDADEVVALLGIIYCGDKAFFVFRDCCYL